MKGGFCLSGLSGLSGHCEERSDEAISPFIRDCRAGPVGLLAMTSFQHFPEAGSRIPESLSFRHLKSHFSTIN
jgi:hypothetical protein